MVRRKFTVNGPIDERTAQAKYMSRKRADQRDITIDFSLQDLARRQRCFEDPELFLTTYFPDIFYMPFCDQQRAIVAGVYDRMINGGMQARAEPRGSGKTTILKGVIIYGFVYQLIHWVPWIEANLELAKESIEDIKLYVEDKHGDDLLAADFPEYVIPIRALDGQSRRCKMQTYKGQRTKTGLGSGLFQLPVIDSENTPNNTPAGGGLVQAFGAEKPIRGLVRQDKRPDFVVINDVETDETAKSVTQTENIKRNLEKAVRGLAGPGQQIGMIMLCTIIARNCLADQFTDRDRNPQWQGVRTRLMAAEPTRQDLWDKYCDLRRQDFKNGCPDTGLAMQFYKDHRDDMDAGAVVTNPLRYLEDKEISALQHCFNLIADMGSRENFDCEYQNDPSDDMNVSDQLIDDAVCQKVNGLAAYALPAGTVKVTAAVDVHDRHLYHVVVAWQKTGTGSIIDYGTLPVNSPAPGSVTESEKIQMVDLAIREALDDLSDYFANHGVHPTLVLVDSGYRPEVVYAFCGDGRGVWRPAKGGTGRKGAYRTPEPGPKVARIGDGYHVSRLVSKSTFLINLDPNKWKKRAHDALRVPDIAAAGSLSLYGAEPSNHRGFAQQITAEAYNKDKHVFEVIRRANHWLDCLAGCCAGAEISGISLMDKPPKKRRKLSELQKEKQRQRRAVAS